MRGTFDGGVPSTVLEVRWTGKAPLTATLVLSQPDRRGNAGYNYKGILLSVTSHDTRDGQQTMAAHSSQSLVASDDMRFCSGRDVALEYTFQPRPEPYLVIPRVYEKDAKGVAYVVGFLSPEEADGGALSIAFKTLPATCAVFKNYTAFKYAGATDAEAEFQVKAPRCAPATAKGHQIAPRWEILGEFA